MIGLGAIEKALLRPMSVLNKITFIEHEGLVMMIDRCPRFVQRFLGSRTAGFSKPQRCHLWRIVLAMAVGTCEAKLSHLAAMILGGRHRTRLGGFLREADWDAPGVLREQVLATLRWMRPRRGETIELLIDDTRVAKRARRMAALQKIWDHSHQRFVRGHIWVVAAIRFRGVVLPWRIELWKPRRAAADEHSPRVPASGDPSRSDHAACWWTKAWDVTLEARTVLAGGIETAQFEYLVAGRGATAVAIGADAMLLADLARPNNRCELLLRRQQDFVLYERIGQRPLAVADAQRITAPVGVGAKASAEYVSARFDLFLQRSERATDDPTEHPWPRWLRLRGDLRLPRVDLGGPPGLAIRDLESLLASPPRRLHQRLTNNLPVLHRPLLPQHRPGLSQEPPPPPPDPPSPAGGDRPAPPEVDQHRSS